MEIRNCQICYQSRDFLTPLSEINRQVDKIYVRMEMICIRYLTNYSISNLHIYNKLYIALTHVGSYDKIQQTYKKQKFISHSLDVQDQGISSFSV